MDKFCERDIAEDNVEYCFYHKKSASNGDFARNELRRLAVDCQALVVKETCGYIWQNQAFSIVPCEKNGLPCLSGSTNYGDFVDDEWLIVYLIHLITKHFEELVGTVCDCDGQFLLIEAAEHLPKWISPDTSTNRVFVSRGVLHLILKPQTPGDVVILPVNSPTLEQALFAIENYPWVTQASSKILCCIGNRINKFSNKVLQNIFQVNVFINRKLVYILDEHPQLISSCVRAFYLRDPVDLQACRQFKSFPPEDRVWTTIPMTKCHYAQLLQQHFVADERSGYKIDASLQSTQRKGYDLGMKICHGFEILCSKAKMCDGVTTGGFDKQQEKDFVASLTRLGYFKNEIKGSKRHNEMLEQALQYVRDAKMSQENSSTKNSASHLIKKTLKKLENMTNLPKLTKLVIHKDDEIPQQQSDDWMYLDDSDVDQLTKDMNDGFEKLSKRGNKAEIEESLLSSVKKVESFVENISSHEGVELEGESPVKLEANLFLNSLAEMLDVHHNSHANKCYESDSDEFLSSSESTFSDEESLSDNDSADHMIKYMREMDNELRETEVGKSFTKLTSETSQQTKDGESCSKIDEPVNIDLNLAENFLQGVQHEAGVSGPISNILGSLGVKLQNVDIIN